MTDNTREAGVRRASLSVAVANRLRGAIAAGEYPRGSRLPVEPDLAEQVGVSRPTLREALKLLEREGLIVRRQRTGTTVSARPFVHCSLERNYSVREVIEGSGEKYGVRDAQIRFVEASPPIAEALELPEGSSLTALERTRTADGKPVIFTIDHLDSGIVESATASLLPTISFYEWLRDHCGLAVSYGVARIAAILASPEIVERLGVELGDPIFKLVQVDYTASGKPVLHSQEFHVADAFEVSVVRTGPYS